jgi:hypothetical protein
LLLNFSVILLTKSHYHFAKLDNPFRDERRFVSHTGESERRKRNAVQGDYDGDGTTDYAVVRPSPAFGISSKARMIISFERIKDLFCRQASMLFPRTITETTEQALQFGLAQPGFGISSIARQAK